MAVSHGFGVAGRTRGIQHDLGIIRIHCGDGRQRVAGLIHQGLKAQYIVGEIILRAAADNVAEVR